MADSITVSGTIATEPNHVRTDEGLDITSFRLASPQRYFDRKKNEWVDGATNWYTITTFRALAVNARQSLHKGERVLVRGRTKVRNWESGERRGTVVEIEAEGLGHDLLWGTTTYTRANAGKSAPAPEVPDDFEARVDVDDVPAVLEAAPAF